jgi:gliding motility-associated-like protein
MRRIGLIAILILLCLNAVARTERDTLGVGTAVAFVENRGQWEAPYLLEAQLHDAALFLETDAVTVALRSHSTHPYPADEPTRYHAYRMHFAGAHGALPTGEYKQEVTNNYFLGSNPARWRSGVACYDAVRYEGLYEGVDLEIYGAARALKYNFTVRAGADPSLVAIEYEGTDGVSVTADGELRIKTSVRDIIEYKPYVYQVVGGQESEVSSRWRVSRTKEGRYRATIEVGDYDHSRDLIIDPMLIFSTYTGSTIDNWGTTAAYDSHKNVYTAGIVHGVGYPVSLGAYQPSFSGEWDIGIFKFDPTGTQRLYATYLGGASADMPHSLFVNSFNELIVFGTTGSTDFPVTAGAYQTTFGGGQNINYFSSIHFPSGSDIFVCRLSADGTQLEASTYVGGSDNDGLNYRNSYNRNYTIMMQGNDSLYYNYGDGARGEIITDNLNNVYIGSTTFSADFPTTEGCVQPQSGGRQDGVVMKLDFNLRNLLWSTYLGGSMDDAVYSIDVDSAYNLLLCGGTSSQDFPVTEGTFQTTYGGGPADGFVGKLAYGGERLITSSFVGNGGYDQLYFVRVGNNDEVCLFGQTENVGTSMIYNAGYGVPGAGMLLMRLNPDLSIRRWSTLFGTPGRINLSPTAFAADICNRVYAAGWGRDFVGYNSVQWNTAGTTGMETTPNAYSDVTDGQDFYIISLDAQANSLEYATFFGQMHRPNDSGGGNDHVDGGTSRFDKMGTLYQSVCASCSGFQGFPTTAGAWSDSNRASNCNNALFRFSVTDDFPVAEFVPPTAGCAPYTVQFQNTGRGDNFIWDFGDGTTSTEHSPSHTYTDGGAYTVTLIAIQPMGCATTDTVRHTVRVIGTNAPYTTHGIACNGGSVQIGPEPQLGAAYQWLTPGVSDPTIANPWVSDSGTYLLRISAQGCSEVDTFVVHSYRLVRRWRLKPISCHDSADGSVTILFGNDINRDSMHVTITPPTTLHLSTNDSVLFGNLGAGDYRVTVTGYGCTKEIEFTVANPAPPRYEKEAITALCTDSCTGSINITYGFSDTPVDTLIDGLCPGTYITTLSDHGCPITDTTVIVRDYSIDSLRAWADHNRIYLGQSVRLHASVNQSANNISYVWAPAGDLDRPDVQNPMATPSDTLVCYTVTATTENNCRRSDSVCVRCDDIICGAPEFVIPNAFTPNGDGVNDRLCFNTDILAEFHIAIFNRWGQCVYESTDASQCWDGTFRNAPCLPGVYTYTCHVRCHSQVENDFKGDITLIR